MLGYVIRCGGAQWNDCHQLVILSVLAKNDDGPHLDHLRPRKPEKSHISTVASFGWYFNGIANTLEQLETSHNLTWLWHQKLQTGGLTDKTENAYNRSSPRFGLNAFSVAGWNTSAVTRPLSPCCSGDWPHKVSIHCTIRLLNSRSSTIGLPSSASSTCCTCFNASWRRCSLASTLLMLSTVC